jgi:hypothetical protein
MRDKDQRNFGAHARSAKCRARSITSISICCLLMIFAFANHPAKAQSNVTAGLQGYVYTDNQQTPAVGARVRIISKDTQIPIGTALTNERGYFVRPDIPPGSYTIEISLQNYVTRTLTYEKASLGMFNDFIPPQVLEREAIAITTNPNPNPTPTPQQTTTAQTTSAQELGVGVTLETQRGGSFSDREVRTLPLGGQTYIRSFDELALLFPGVVSPPEPIGNTVGPGIGPGVGTSGQFSVNGLPSRGNNFMVDGSDNNDEDIGVRRQGFFSLVPQTIESVQEFQIITLLAPAQYGRNLGGQVNVVSKSGTSDFHGAAYAFFNSDKLNARNFFDFKGDTERTALSAGGRPVFVNNQQAFVQNPAGDEDSLTLWQAGGALGGPIIPEKTFFFVAGEGQLLNAVKESHFAVPTVEQRGFLGSGASGISISPSLNLRPTTESGNLIFSLFPLPNDPNGVYGRNTFTQVLPADARGRVISGKVDHYFSIGGKLQTLTGRYNYTDDSRDLPVTGGALFSSLKALVRTDNFSTYLAGDIRNNVSNLFRFSWGRTRLRFDELRDQSFLLPTSSALISDENQRNFLLNAPFLANTTQPGDQVVSYSTIDASTEGRLGAVGQVIIGGFSPVGVDVFNFPQNRVNDTFQFADTVRISTARNHNIAFGADIRRTKLDSDLPRNSRPLITFYGAPNFTGISSLPVTQTTFLPPGDDRCGPQGTVGNALGCSTVASVGSLSGFGSFISPLDLAAVGAPTGYFQSLVEPGRDARINLGYYQLNFFAQDDWRVRNNLFISYGLRYEYNTPPEEADEKIESIFQEPLLQVPVPNLTAVDAPIIVPDIIAGLDEFIDDRNRIFDPDRNNFAPRIGAAYSPFESTVFRGGYGLYYDQILGAVVSQSRNVFPTFTTVNFGGGLPCYLFSVANGVCPVTISPNNNGYVFNLLTPTANPTARGVQAGTLNTLDSPGIRGVFGFLHLAKNGGGSPFGATLPARKLDTPMAHQYYFGIEQQLFGRDMFLSAAYVGTTGRNLLRFTTPNLGSNFIVQINELSVLSAPSNVPGYVSSVPTLRGFTFDPSAGGVGQGRPVANVGTINQFETTGRSQYHSLQMQLRGRLTRTFNYNFNYTFARAKDDVSDVFDLAGSPALPQNSLDLSGEYAVSNFDVRHKFAYSVLFDLPRLRDQGALIRYALGGWQLASTGRFQTGQPFTVNSIFDVNLDGNLTDRLDNTQLIGETEGNEPQILTISGGNLQSMLAPIGSDGSVSRNSFRGRSLLNLDLSLNKSFFFTEDNAIQFRMDVFNLTNRANFAIPVRFLEAPGFGQSVDTVTPGRRVQFALKYLF